MVSTICFAYFESQADIIFHSDDRVYVSPTLSPNMPGDSCRCLQLLTATSSISSVTGSLPQPLSTLNQPPANNPTRTRFLTPLPTPAVHHPPPLRTTASRETPSPQPPCGRVTSHEEMELSEHCPVTISGPEFHYYTSLYPLLASTEMFEYFGMECGVSRRPTGGKFFPRIQLLPPLM